MMSEVWMVMNPPIPLSFTLFLLLEFHRSPLLNLDIIYGFSLMKKATTYLCNVENYIKM